MLTMHIAPPSLWILLVFASLTSLTVNSLPTGANHETSASGIREEPSGAPMYPSPIQYPTELRQGDHILFKTTEPPFRPVYQSALVTGGEKDCVEIISYSRAGIYEDSVRFRTFQCLHRVEYTRCRYSAEKSVSRARWRSKCGEDHYHALYNNSHFLATWAKTGNEYLLYDIINGLTCEEGESKTGVA